MKNQVDAIRGISSDEGIAHVLNSSLTKTAILKVKDDIVNGVTKLLFVAPESLTNWNGSPIYIPKGLLKSAGPLFDLVALFSTGESIICRESVRVLTHGHVYDGSKAQRDLKIEYIDVDSFIHKIISWLISQDLLQLEIKNKS